MNHFCKYFLLLLCLFFSTYSLSSPFYSGKIYVDNISDAFLNESVNDLRDFLKEGTNQSFTVQSFNGKTGNGIYIVLDKPGLLSNALEVKLRNGSIEDFVWVADKDRFLLVANHPLGLSRAIYTYLDALGFKWYMPGEEWTYIPSLSKITISATTYTAPSFHLRDFYGTGGILPIASIDPEHILEKKWNDWKRRNRMGGEFHLSGHYGDTFNEKYKAELQKHPEYLALVNRKREWSANAKWCISNKDFRELFIADRVAELKQRLRDSKYDNEIVPVTVDPADGYGDCECDQCKKLGSVSDRTYLLANEVAAALQKVSPRGFANLYAYNTHAAAPSFKVNGGVIVALVPYAFQTISSPEQMIEAWGKQSSNLWMYDYYGIPDWHQNMPLTGGWGIDAWMKRVNYWYRKGIKGFVYESSYSIGSNGVGLYLSGRTGWDINENYNKVLQLFYNRLFGRASSYIKTYFEKINSDFLGAADIPYLLEQLYQASNATKDAQVQKRISVLKSYVHYLVLYYRQKQNSGSPQLLTDLFQYVLQTYPSGVIHSTYLAELLQRQMNESLLAKWKVYAPVGTEINRIKFLRDDQIEANFLQDRKQYPLLEGFSYKATSSVTRYSVKVPTNNVIENPQGMLILEFPQTYVQGFDKGVINFMVKVNESSQNNQHQRLTIKLIDTATNQEIVNQEIEIDKNWKTVTLKAMTGKTYELKIKNSNWMRLSVSNNQWMAFKNIPTYSVLGKLWFYNHGDKYIYFSNTNKDQPSFKNSKNQQLTVERVNDQNLFRVTTDSKAGWYQIENEEYKTLQFYNRALLFFPHSNIAIK